VLVGGRRSDRSKGAGDKREQSRNENEALHFVSPFRICFAGRC
jgi:hypothetical protein